MNETDCAYHRGYGRSLGMRNNAQDTDLPRRIDGCCNSAVPATSAAPATAAASDANLPGWVGDPGSDGLPAPSASAAATAGA